LKVKTIILSLSIFAGYAIFYTIGYMHGQIHEEKNQTLKYNSHINAILETDHTEEQTKQPDSLDENLDYFLTYYLLINSMEFDYLNSVQKFTYYRAIANACSIEYIDDPYLLCAIGLIESRINPSAISPYGAMGINQVTSIAAKEVYIKMGWNFDEFRQYHLYDINKNIQISALYLSFLIEKYGNLEAALSVYNGLKPYSSSYSRKVLSTRKYLMECYNNGTQQTVSISKENVS